MAFTSPKRTVIPSRASTGAAMRTLSTKVPLALPRSAMVRWPPRTVSCDWACATRWRCRFQHVAIARPADPMISFHEAMRHAGTSRGVERLEMPMAGRCRQDGRRRRCLGIGPGLPMKGVRYQEMRRTLHDRPGAARGHGASHRPAEGARAAPADSTRHDQAGNRLVLASPRRRNPPAWATAAPRRDPAVGSRVPACRSPTSRRPA